MPRFASIPATDAHPVYHERKHQMRRMVRHGGLRDEHEAVWIPAQLSQSVLGWTIGSCHIPLRGIVINVANGRDELELYLLDAVAYGDLPLALRFS